MRRTDQLPDAFLGFTEAKQAVDLAMRPELVVQANQGDAVTRARIAIGIDLPPRHDEQRNALATGRTARYLGQHQMDDVLGNFMVAAADPHFVAAQGIATVRKRFGDGTDVGQTGAGLGLRKAHGAVPAAFDHRREVASLLVFTADLADQIGGRFGEKRIAVGRHIRAGKDAAQGRHQGVGKSEPAFIERRSHAEESGIAVGRKRLRDFRHQHDTAVFDLRRIGIRLGRVRQELGLGKGQRGIQHGLHGVGVGMRELWNVSQVLGIQPVEQKKIQIITRWQHRSSSSQGG